MAHNTNPDNYHDTGPVAPVVDKPRSSGRLATEWGERIPTNKFLHLGQPDDREKHSAVYEALNYLGGEANWYEIALHVQARHGFLLEKREINAIRSLWTSVDNTTVTLPALVGDEQHTDETMEVDPPSNLRHSPDR